MPEITRILNQALIDKLPTFPIRQEEWREKIKKRLDDNALLQEKSAPGNKSFQQIYKTNDFVMVHKNVIKSRKLESEWTGPYRVTAEVLANRYQLRRVFDTSESNKITAVAAS